MNQEKERGDVETQAPLPGQWRSQRLNERDPSSSRGIPLSIHAWRTVADKASSADDEEEEERGPEI
jgi:hypothetical protein